MRECAVCGVASALWCGGCSNIAYCSQAHQKKVTPGSEKIL